eukprot:SAG31_NODE_7973_length_1551_cov_1.342975_1_plen_127_part_10
MVIPASNNRRRLLQSTDVQRQRPQIVAPRPPALQLQQGATLILLVGDTACGVTRVETAAANAKHLDRIISPDISATETAHRCSATPRAYNSAVFGPTAARSSSSVSTSTHSCRGITAALNSFLIIID